ncbi:MAG: hydantoinase/oxoprolinase N-terminal domain-containing protein, partial [Planctomycetota bacterium]
MLYDASRKPIAQGICSDFCGSTGSIRVEGLSNTQAAVTYEFVPGIEAPVLAVRMMLGVPLERPLPILDVRLGTTRATNALLTRSGEPTALVTTKGFEDLIEIGYQERPELFAIHVQKRPKLYTHSVGIVERLDASGNVLIALDESQAQEQLRSLWDSGIRSLAICLLHSYK